MTGYDGSILKNVTGALWISEMALGNWLYREAGCGNKWQYLVAIIKGLVSSGLQRDSSGLMQGDLICSPRSQIVSPQVTRALLQSAPQLLPVLEQDAVSPRFCASSAPEFEGT